MPATLTVHDHRRETDGSFRLAVLVHPADVAAFAAVAADAVQEGESVLATVAWAADVPVEQQLAETRRLIDSALRPPEPAPAPGAAPVELLVPGTEL